MNKYFYGDPTKTFRLKTIASTYEIFKAQVEENNYFGNYVTFTDEQLEIMYYVLLSNYGNSYVRHQMIDLFYTDCSNVLLNVYSKYGKLWTAIKSVYEMDVLSNGGEVWNENGEDYTETDNLSKYAETPTEIEASTDFYDNYTNSATKTNNERNQSTKKDGGRAYTINPVEALQRAMGLTDYRLDELAQEFAHLFVQVEGDIPLIYYSEVI